MTNKELGTDMLCSTFTTMITSFFLELPSIHNPLAQNDRKMFFRRMIATVRSCTISFIGALTLFPVRGLVLPAIFNRRWQRMWGYMHMIMYQEALVYIGNRNVNNGTFP